MSKPPARVALFLRPRTPEADQRVARKFPGREIEWVPLIPKDRDEARRLIEEGNFDAVLLPKETLVDALLSGDTPFLIQKGNDLARLLRTNLDTEPFTPR